LNRLVLIVLGIFAGCAPHLGVQSAPPRDSTVAGAAEPRPYRFPWPDSIQSPLVAGVRVGIDRTDAERTLGVPTEIAEVDHGLTLLVFPHFQVGIREGRVEGVNLMTSQAGLVDSIGVGMHPLAALNRWGHPTRLESGTGAAVWSAAEWEIAVYLTSSGDKIQVVQIRRRREK
jgi:hypothetical protein